METLILQYIGNDDWSRPVYKGDDGKLFVDTDPRCVYPNLCTKSGNDFYGEPDTPIRYIKKNIKMWKISRLSLNEKHGRK